MTRRQDLPSLQLTFSVFTPLVLFLVGTSNGQLTTVSSFNSSNTGGGCGIGFDSTVWVYGCSSATVDEYSNAGTFLFQVARPGESANDVDVEVAPETLTLSSTVISPGTLLFINGENGPAEIYAIDKTNGTILATLVTSFGNSHVVGGGYHAGRNTFFLVQDRLAGATSNLVGEVDPVTGNVLNTFSTLASGFDVNFGDLDVSNANGNLFIVSSIETAVAEFTPAGVLVQELALPAGVNSLSGIAIDDLNGEAWVAETGGDVWQLDGFPRSLPGDYNMDDTVDAADYVLWRKTPNNFGGTPEGYDTWRVHFGQTAGSGSGASMNAAVPEPATLVMFIVAAVGIRLWRRHIA